MFLVIDSSGLELLARGEWYEERHGRARRAWRKLHIAVDAGTGEITACLLTDIAADNAGQVPALLAATSGELASVTADGAYDGGPVYRAVALHQARPGTGLRHPTAFAKGPKGGISAAGAGLVPRPRLVTSPPQPPRCAP